MCVVPLLALLLHYAAAQQPKLTVNTTSVPKSGTWVTVTWEGIKNPTDGDAVALFAANATSGNAITGVPVRFKWAVQAPTWKQGYGKLEFQLLNHRMPVIFHYFSNVGQSLLTINPPILTGSPPYIFVYRKIVASSSVIQFEQPAELMHLHLALTDDPSEMLVQWVSSSDSTPVVEYGTQPNALTMMAIGNSSTYTADDLCGGPANSSSFFSPGYFHYVLLTGLQPATTYYFTARNEDVNATISSNFTTGPLPGRNSSVTIIGWADSGQTTADGSYLWDLLFGMRPTVAPSTPQSAYTAIWENQNFVQGQQPASADLVTAVQQQLPLLGPSILLLHQGDIAYAHGNVAEWDQFFALNAPNFARYPYMTVPGNHERDFPNSGDRFGKEPNRDSGGECGVPYMHRLRMPQPSMEEQWYAFSYGPVRFIQMSSEQEFSPGSPQYVWLTQQLAAVNRTQFPWLVVGLHRPMYTTSIQGTSVNSDPGVAESLRTSLEDLFLLYNVDMIWTGHIHLYERTCPVFRKQCQGFAADGSANAPVHVTFGNGGYELWWLSNPKPPSYWEAVFLEFGYIIAQANATHFRVQAMSTENPGILDDYTLTKPIDWVPTNRQAMVQTVATQTTGGNWWDNGVPSQPAGILYVAALLALKDPSVPILQGLVAANLTTISDPLKVADLQDLATLLKPYWQLARNDAILKRLGVDNATASVYFDSVVQPIMDLMQKGITNWTTAG